MLRVRRYALAGLTVGLLLSQPAQGPVGADAPQYLIEDLGTIDGLVPTVTGVNASGQVSGIVNGPSGNRAVRFREPGGWSYVPGLESVMSAAQAINSYGDLTGYAITAEGLRAFRYSDGAGVQFIQPMAGGSYTIGMAINASGEVAGYGDTADGLRGFRAPAGLPAQTLPTLGGSFVLACGINDDGQVVGSADTADFVQHTFRANPDNTVIHFGGFAGASSMSGGCAIDNTGRVAGQASTDTGASHASLYNGSLADLDTFGSSSSNADATANGVTVGFYIAADGSPRAFVNTAGSTVDLNTRIPADSGWTLTQAHGVSTAGHIVGEGTLNGQTRAYRLTPPPPPPPPADTNAPTIKSLSASPSLIWPANGQWVKVVLSVQASDDSGVAPVCQLTTISADEGSTDDAKILDASTGQVRALRNKHEEQRVYTFQVTCGDQAGNQSQAEVNVTVAKNRDFGLAAIKRAALQHKCVLAFAKYHKGKGKGRR